jgi:hypothetical protein
MEERRIREIARMVEGGYEQHRGDPPAFAGYMQQCGIVLVDIVEALEDVGRLDTEEADGVASLLRLAVEQLRAAGGVT